METRIRDCFDSVTMPQDCEIRIRNALGVKQKSTSRRLLKAAASIAAALILILGVVHRDTLTVYAQEFYHFVVHTLSPNAEELLGKQIGEIDPQLDNGYSDITLNYGDQSAGITFSGGYFVEVIDGRLYFTGNMEYIDITDLCSMDTPYIYVLEDNTGILHYLFVGGTPENYGYGEFMYNPNRNGGSWSGGGHNHLDRSNHWEPYGWFVSAIEQLDIPCLY